MTSKTFTESLIEQATLDWFKEMEYAVLNGPDIGPGDLCPERSNYTDVILEDRGRSGRSVVNSWSTEELLCT